MANDQKTAKIRAALSALDPANPQHWTDDGLPREGVVRKMSGEPNVQRKDIQEAWPGFQRPKPGETAGHDPLTGEATPAKEAAPASGADPTKNEGELMTEEEVRSILEQRVAEAQNRITAAQQGVRDANREVLDAVAAHQDARADLAREFPPMTANENVKQYIASEMAQRAAAAGHMVSGIAPGSQIDMAMQRSNSRGWRRPSRGNLGTQTGAMPPNAA